MLLLSRKRNGLFVKSRGCSLLVQHHSELLGVVSVEAAFANRCDDLLGETEAVLFLWHWNVMLRVPDDADKVSALELLQVRKAKRRCRCDAFVGVAGLDLCQHGVRVFFRCDFAHLEGDVLGLHLGQSRRIL